MRQSQSSDFWKDHNEAGNVYQEPDLQCYIMQENSKDTRISSPLGKAKEKSIFTANMRWSALPAAAYIQTQSLQGYCVASNKMDKLPHTGWRQPA